MYSTHHDWKSVVAEKFSRTLKNEIYKDIISISKNVYIDELDHIFNKCNNTYYSTINMKLVDVKSNTYIDTNKENIRKILNLKLVTMKKYQHTKILLWKDKLQISLKKFLWLKKLKTLFHGLMLLVILMMKKIESVWYRMSQFFLSRINVLENCKR